MSKKAAFLIEAMVVFAVIVTIMAAAVPTISGNTQKVSHSHRCKTDFASAASLARAGTGLGCEKLTVKETNSGDYEITIPILEECGYESNSGSTFAISTNTNSSSVICVDGDGNFVSEDSIASPCEVGNCTLAGGSICTGGHAAEFRLAMKDCGDIYRIAVPVQ